MEDISHKIQSIIKRISALSDTHKVSAFVQFTKTNYVYRVSLSLDWKKEGTSVDNRVWVDGMGTFGSDLMPFLPRWSNEVPDATPYVDGDTLTTFMVSSIGTQQKVSDTTWSCGGNFPCVTLAPIDRCELPMSGAVLRAMATGLLKDVKKKDTELDRMLAFLPDDDIDPITVGHDNVVSAKKFLASPGNVAPVCDSPEKQRAIERSEKMKKLDAALQKEGDLTIRH